MRKKTLSNLFDNIFWYIIYAFPIIAYLIMLFINPYGEEFSEPVVETKTVYTLTIPENTYLGSTIPTRTTWTCAIFTSGANGKFIFLPFVAVEENVANSSIAAFDKNTLLVFNSSGYTLHDYVFELPYAMTSIPSVLRICSGSVGTSSQWDWLYTFTANDKANFVLSSYEDVVSITQAPVSKTSFSSFFEQMGFGFATDNIVVNNLEEIFGAGGVMPIFSTDTPFIIFGWFICVFIIHLAVDFLLFLPRLAHKWMNDFSEG